VTHLWRDRSPDRERQRGQGLVEFTMVVPVVLLLVVSVAELGLAYGNKHTIGYGSREGARVGSALATGSATDCLSGPDPSLVDATLVSAVQRILKSPGSGIDIDNVEEIRIFKADAAGDETSGFVNVWQYTGAGTGPDVDPGETYGSIDFNLVGPNAWPACARDNSTATPDSIGVTVRYRYDFVTPMPSVINAIAGGALSLELAETTVMSLNPST
jgi:TadE-like protein